MSAAQSTVALAEHVAQAYFHGNKKVAKSQAESTSLLKEFVGLMNVHAAQVGVQNTIFSNEHGGDAGHPGLPTPYASARDFARMWSHFTATDPTFLQYLGLRSYEHLSLIPWTRSIRRTPTRTSSGSGTATTPRSRETSRAASPRRRSTRRTGRSSRARSGSAARSSPT
jgi:D-alanyl-D-alanine carboxypeptidase